MYSARRATSIGSASPSRSRSVLLSASISVRWSECSPPEARCLSSSVSRVAGERYVERSSWPWPMLSAELVLELAIGSGRLDGQLAAHGSAADKNWRRNPAYAEDTEGELDDEDARSDGSTDGSRRWSWSISRPAIPSTAAVATFPVRQFSTVA